VYNRVTRSGVVIAVNIRGESYRLRQHRKAGLVPSSITKGGTTARRKCQIETDVSVKNETGADAREGRRAGPWRECTPVVSACERGVEALSGRSGL